MARDASGTKSQGEGNAAASALNDVREAFRGVTIRSLAIAFVAVALLSALMFPFRSQLGVLNVLLLYLLLTFYLALSAGLWPAVFSAIFGFLVFDLVFIPPYLTFTVAEPDHVLALFVYLGVAIVTARLVSGIRERTEEALRETRRMTLLAELNAALISEVSLNDILNRIAERVVSVYGAAGCRVLLAEPEGGFTVAAHYPASIGTKVDRTGLALAEWSMEHRQPVGRSSRGRRVVGLPKEPVNDARQSGGRKRSDVLYLPIQSTDRVAGVLEVIGRPGAGAFHAEDEQLLTTFVDQAALALERARLGEEAARAAVHAKSDELKSALLSAVSHDLRTPLASIKASATSLLDESVAWDAEARREFLAAIDEETDRLTMMVSNLLDLSRIEGGALRPQMDWYDLDELIADVRQRVAARTEGRPLTVEIEDDLPLLQFDYVEIAQVLTNLVENAIKYTPPGTPIEITARQVPGAIEVSVHDDGPGIAPAQQERIFEKFYRAPGRRAAPGAGIGLSICKGLVEAHGGTIEVESAPGAGTTFRFTLPLASENAGAGAAVAAHVRGAAA